MVIKEMKLYKRFFMGLILSLMIIQNAYANEPYQGYVYNEWDKAIAAPNGYIPKDIFCGEDIGVGAFKQPKDLYVSDDGDLYILDSGNGRIVIINRDNELVKVIDSFRYNGNDYTLKEPEGFYITDEETIYIADTGNEKVLMCDFDGNINKIIEKPVSNIYPESLAFQPIKILVDSSETIYVLVKNLFYGAVTYDIDGKFIGYYGSNKVQLTGKMIFDQAWKKLLSKTQTDKMSRYVPVEFPSFDIDDKDFVYTVTENVSHESPNEQIKKLNPRGTNIFPSKQYGDMEFIIQGTYGTELKTINTRFIDVDVDENYFVNALDFERGRVFQYDSEGDLMFSFGCYGEQLGTFTSPVAVESRNGEVLVLDEKRADITTFELSSFGENVHNAVKLLNDGLYNEALEPWKEVLKMNSNYRFAYYGVGKAYMYTEDYDNALKYFELAYTKDSYSKAFKEHRTEKIRNNFLFYAVVLIVLILMLTTAINKKSFLRRLIARKISKRKVAN